ncbi:hypothetical protein [Coleofasciculus sp. E2-BRE-01]|uniref:hypothetical protein n=1 Tax=Coleofasciculus sp. E2-BRE-01 TaxID=3069524 RepID=UPI0032FF7952
MVNLPTQTDPPLSPRQTLPTMYDLPSDNSFRGINRLWLRWMTLEGELILTPEEEAVAERERAERLAARLRELGVEPDDVE